MAMLGDGSLWRWLAIGSGVDATGDAMRRDGICMALPMRCDAMNFQAMGDEL